MCNKHQIITKSIAKDFLPKRPQDVHKYNLGHILIIAGSKNYTGAAILAAEGCLSVGCGLVSLAVPESIYETTVARIRPEIIVCSLPKEEHGSISEQAIDDVLEYVQKRKVDTICIGCGLGREEKTKNFVNGLLKVILSPQSNIQKEVSVVIDADGFNLLEVENKKMKVLKNSTKKVILTPHTGEFKNLFSITDAEFEKIQNEPCLYVEEFAKNNNVVLVLKSSTTTISDGEYIFKLNQPNNALAKGGSGDVLAGIIAGLCYQIKNYNKTLLKYNFLLKSAVLGVYLHSQSAFIGKKQKTEFCFTPTDIVKYLPDVFKELI